MIKFIQCVRRKPGLSKQEFREHWAGYSEKVKAIAEASDAKRCVLSTALVVDQNMDIMRVDMGFEVIPLAGPSSAAVAHELR